VSKKEVAGHMGLCALYLYSHPQRFYHMQRGNPQRREANNNGDGTDDAPNDKRAYW
jgi:hypothetical protein